ncbi:hypothetical protein CYMTET_49986 [Cymbomonas tetramitiformis]|uniref:EF-hand domain-containing protein n=1 Tax=Cymbomonas tetramitiformis TaxID=36881 RepID=A0AAE0BQR7_9CHLO|nr:hypothetical protein CYMTET_49986 [Cymbomonas tetramitiformis]
MSSMACSLQASKTASVAQNTARLEAAFAKPRSKVLISRPYQKKPTKQVVSCLVRDFKLASKCGAFNTKIPSRNRSNARGSSLQVCHVSTTYEEDMMLIKIFNEVDTDRSGEIDEDEFLVLCGKLGLTSRAEALSHFAVLDVDKSGTVDFEEFIEWWPMYGKLFAAAQTDDLTLIRVFNEVDTDRSGEIDTEEFLALCTRLGVTSTEEALGYFAEVDTDGSGEINFTEFAAWWPKSLLRCYSVLLEIEL